MDYVWMIVSVGVYDWSVCVCVCVCDYICVWRRMIMNVYMCIRG